MILQMICEGDNTMERQFLNRTIDGDVRTILLGIQHDIEKLEASLISKSSNDDITESIFLLFSSIKHNLPYIHSYNKALLCDIMYNMGSLHNAVILITKLKEGAGISE